MKVKFQLNNKFKNTGDLVCVHKYHKPQQLAGVCLNLYVNGWRKFFVEVTRIELVSLRVPIWVLFTCLGYQFNLTTDPKNRRSRLPTHSTTYFDLSRKSQCLGSYCERNCWSRCKGTNLVRHFADDSLSIYCLTLHFKVPKVQHCMNSYLLRASQNQTPPD